MINRKIFKRDLHDLSHYVIGDTLGGTLKCVGVTENLPNDTFVGKTEAIIRVNPMKHPTMHPLKSKLYHVWCPTRLVWPDFHKFITQGKYGSTPPVLPWMTVSAADALPGTLLNSLGVKAPAGMDTFKIAAIVPSMFNKICNELFMDQDLGTPRANSEASGDRTGLEDITNFQCNWPNDYFNTARPWAQKSMSIPIPQSNVVSNGEDVLVSDSTVTDRNWQHDASNVMEMGGAGAAADSIKFGSETGLEMDDSAKMRDLSLAGALQIFFENRATDGSRFIEYLRSAFGSNVKDTQVQNPVILGYKEKTIQFSEVVATGITEDQPLGALGGHGVGGFGTNEYKYYMGEHGYFFTFAYVMPENAYLDSMERFWFYENFWDIYQHEFAAIGQQPVYNGEIRGRMAEGAGPTGRRGTWGWQDRYSQYMRSLNRITGLFETTNKDWTMAREFLTPPELNEAFVTGAPTTRIFADYQEGQPTYQIMAFNKIIARRNVKRSVRKRIL